MKTHKKLFDQEIYNIILIHVARTWERIRMKQPFQEMPQHDNISSTDEIEYIATEINGDSIIQEFLKTRNGEIWLETEEGMSDIYIESLTEKIINRDYL